MIFRTCQVWIESNNLAGEEEIWAYENMKSDIMVNQEYTS